jgi:ATP-dependent Clp protease adapter protein ClpS
LNFRLCLFLCTNIPSTSRSPWASATRNLEFGNPSCLRDKMKWLLMIFYVSIFLLCLMLPANALSVRGAVSRGKMGLRQGGFTLQPSLRSSSLLRMVSRGGGGGSTKLDNKTKQDTSTKPTYRDEIEKDWRLILHDDTVHTIQQVCEILSATCPLCAGPRAYEVTLEVHMTGAGTVAVANKKIIQEYSNSLQQAGLSVSMAPDDDFVGADDAE